MVARFPYVPQVSPWIVTGERGWQPSGVPRNKESYSPAERFVFNGGLFIISASSQYIQYTNGETIVLYGR